MVKASVAPGADHSSSHSCGPNVSAIRFPNGGGWERIENIHAVAATLLNAATGNIENFQKSSMMYPSSLYRPDAKSEIRWGNSNSD